MKRLLFIVLLAFTVTDVFSQKINFEANAPGMVTAGEVFRVEFNLNAKPDGFTPPTFNNFDVLAGPSTSQGQSVSIVNGNVTQSVSFTYTYVLQANSAGKYTIPAATVNVDGKSYSTRALPIEVMAADAAGAGAGGGTSAGAGGSNGAAAGAISNRTAGQGIAPDDILVRVIVNKNNVYKGQPIKVTFKLYTRVSISGVESAKYPVFNGFWSQELNTNAQGWQRETYNNKVYDTRIIKETLLYPQQSGKLFIEQFNMTVVAQIVTTARRQSLFDDFFGGGSNIQEVRKVLVAQPIQINVKELPSGAPASFQGAVGKFQLSAKLDQPTFAANSSNSYTLKLSGNGNLPLIQAPKIALPASFEQYNVKTTESLNNESNGITGYRMFEYPFIPRAEGDYTIEPVELSYFDPDQGRYVTLTTESFNVTVTADTQSDGISSGGLVSGLTKEDLKILNKDIRFIKTGNPTLHHVDYPWFGSISYYLTLLLIIILSIAGYYVKSKQLKDKQNFVLVKGKKANKVALNRLKMAHSHMTKGDQRAFYEEMLKALWGYLSDKLNMPVSELTKENSLQAMINKGVSQELADEYLKAISDCEYAQYSPSASLHLGELYNSALELLSKIETTIKR